MEIRVDENMPRGLADVLADLGHDVDTVFDEEISGADDGVVWQTAQQADRFLITQDLDFSDVRRYTPGTHQGLMLIRLHKPGREVLVSRVRAIFEAYRVETWKGCLVVGTEHRIRVRPPKRPK